LDYCTGSFGAQATRFECPVMAPRCMSSRNPTSPSISRTASPKPFSEYCNGRCGSECGKTTEHIVEVGRLSVLTTQPALHLAASSASPERKSPYSAGAPCRSLATTGGWPTSNRNGRDQIGINGRPSEYEDALPVQREADTSGPGMDTEKTNGDPAPPAITSFSPARNRTSSVQK
jgi:hypothetical protein